MGGGRGGGRERESTNLLSIIDKIDFIRDIIAYMCAVALVIAVAYDGDVSCVTIMFLVALLSQTMNRCVYGRQSAFCYFTSFT